MECGWSHLVTNVKDENKKPLLVKEDVSTDFPLLAKHLAIDNYVHNGNRRTIVGCVIASICLGVFVLTFAASSTYLLSSVRFTLCGAGGIILLSGFVFLTCIDQDDERHSFGHSGGFTCPLVPLLPIISILINSYLLISLGLRCLECKVHKQPTQQLEKPANGRVRFSENSQTVENRLRVRKGA